MAAYELVGDPHCGAERSGSRMRLRAEQVPGHPITGTERLSMKSAHHSKPFTRFCGIDVAKNKRVACVLDQDGQFVARSQSFDNDAKGY